MGELFGEICSQNGFFVTRSDPELRGKMNSSDVVFSGGLVSVVDGVFVGDIDVQLTCSTTSTSASTIKTEVDFQECMEIYLFPLIKRTRKSTIAITSNIWIKPLSV